MWLFFRLNSNNNVRLKIDFFLSNTNCTVLSFRTFIFLCHSLNKKKCRSFKFLLTEMTVLSQHCWHVSLYCREKFQLKLLWFKLWAQQIRCMRYFELSFMSSSTQNNGVECQISFVKCSWIIWVFSVYSLFPHYLKCYMF